MFYCKDDEIEARGHKLPDDIVLRDNLIDYADNKLRGELTLRSIQLKEKNLSIASQWNESTPMEQLITYIESLNMSEKFSITPVDLDGLPARLIAVYKLWKEGEVLRAFYSNASFYRYRSEFLKLAIDCGVRKPSKFDNIIPLFRFLQSEEIAKIPEWAIGTALYFDLKKQA